MTGFPLHLCSHTIFLWCGEKLNPITKYLDLIRKKSKVQETNMSYKHALNFDQWKIFSENYKPMKVWLWLVYKIIENYCRSWLSSEFIQTQKSHLISIDKMHLLTCHIKLKFFLWTKLLENLLLAKYLASIAASLTEKS